MSANIEEENQITGLVARSKPSLQRAEGSAPEISVPTPPSNTGSRWSACHAHEPIVANEIVDATRILLMRFDEILAAAAEATANAHINKHQCKLAARRLRLIAATLRQMPQPAPSQQLLTAMKSLCLLLRQCAYDGGVVASTTAPVAALKVLYGPDGDPLGPAQCWPLLLCQHFTSQLLFQGAYRRLWAAWSMYSHMDLEREDGVAESLDFSEDGQVMMELFFPTGVPCGKADQPTSEETGSVSRHLRDLQAYYQRRKMSPWRILYQDLIPGVQRPQSAPATVERAVDDDGICFRVLPHVYWYNGVPVVVKALGGTEGMGDAETTAAMQHATEFILDVVCRTTWCHPHIVTCLGGFTERFVGGGANATNVEVGEKAAEERPASTGKVNPPWQRALSSAVTGQPIMTLGYVLELQSSLTPFTAADPAQSSHITLHDLLFGSASSSASLPVVGRHYFTLHEALDICAQVADALQYIMNDSHEVSEAVRTAWLTVDPANIFVVRVVGLSKENEPMQQQERQQKRGVSGDQHARGTSSPLSVNSKSAVWKVSATPFAEGGGREEARVAGPTDLQRGAFGSLEDIRGHVDQSLLHKADTAQTPSEWETEVYVCGAGRTSHGSADNPLRHGSRHFVVRYSPPCRWTPHRISGIRWRPHARATAPASYAVVQLFLALMTGKVPYEYIKTDREVDEQVFAGATHAFDNTSDTTFCLSDVGLAAQVKPRSSSQGYPIPPWLPPMVATWCRRALSLDHSEPSMELEVLRETLTTMQATLPEYVRHAHLHAGDDATKGNRGASGDDTSTYQEMQSCMGDETLDV